MFRSASNLANLTSGRLPYKYLAEKGQCPFHFASPPSFVWRCTRAGKLLQTKKLSQPNFSSNPTRTTQDAGTKPQARSTIPLTDYTRYARTRWLAYLSKRAWLAPNSSHFVKTVLRTHESGVLLERSFRRTRAVCCRIEGRRSKMYSSHNISGHFSIRTVLLNRFASC